MTNTSTNTSANILTVGSLAFDSIRSPAGEVDLVIGGAGNFFSIAASFYSKIQLIGVVGNDFPGEHLKLLQGRGIDTSGVEIVANGKTFHWTGEYNENLNEAKTLSTQLNVLEHFRPKLSEVQKKSKYIFLANNDPSTQEDVLNQAKGHKFIACDTMNFWITGKLEEVRRVLKKVDLLSINEGEAYLLSKKRTLLEAARTIQGMGPSILMIKRGEYGASLFVGDDVFLAPAYPVERVVDPTGAGDSFAGAAMGFLVEAGIHRDMVRDERKKVLGLLKRSLLAGCAMASFTVEDFGLKRLLGLKKDELVARQHKLIEMISI